MRLLRITNGGVCVFVFVVFTVGRIMWGVGAIGLVSVGSCGGMILGAGGIWSASGGSDGISHPPVAFLIQSLHSKSLQDVSWSMLRIVLLFGVGT